MNVIDHAILISASPAFIWRFLGDISQNPKWQEDCTNTSFLTTQHEGKGARWRYSTPKGKDIVVEITAWYDTLGYEYMIVDGSSVSENKGRVRLQEIAEGTLVQWTFNYEVEGAFSGFRNSMGLKRKLSNNIQDSLRNLYKLIQAETGGIGTHEAKALLKEAPDVEERSIYEPRHPSSIKDNLEETFSEPDYPSEQPISYNIQGESILEPPVADDDTKPNPVVQGTEEIDEPTFLQQIPEPPIAIDDTEPNAPISDEDIATYSSVDEIAESMVEAVEPTPAPKDVTQETVSTPEPSNPTPSPDIRDTASVSVFDIFGLQKPSETQEVKALSDEDLAESNIESVMSIAPIPAMEEEQDKATDNEDNVDSNPEEIATEAKEDEVAAETDDQNEVQVEADHDETGIGTSEQVADNVDKDNVDDKDESTIIESTPTPLSLQSNITKLRLDLRNKKLDLRYRKQ